MIEAVNYSKDTSEDLMELSFVLVPSDIMPSSGFA